MYLLGNLPLAPSVSLLGEGKPNSYEAGYLVEYLSFKVKRKWPGLSGLCLVFTNPGPESDRLQTVGLPIQSSRASPTFKVSSSPSEHKRFHHYFMWISYIYFYIIHLLLETLCCALHCGIVNVTTLV
jgi:hypothetical protein